MSAKPVSADMCSLDYVENVDVSRAKSVHEAAHEEAQRHKWIESQKHGRDLGESALRDWYRLYWVEYCRYCHLEHLEGNQPWREFNPEMFGDLLGLMQSKDVLLDRILDRVCTGQENLEILSRGIDDVAMDRQRSIRESGLARN